jgi:hypothetical protein
VLNKIKRASLILVDDEEGFYLPPFCAYPVLDRQFKMDPEAELLGHRMQRYIQNHHLLPRRVVMGRELKPESINAALNNFERYLGIPIFKLAFHDLYRTYTENWHFCDHQPPRHLKEKAKDKFWLARFLPVLLGFILERRTQFKTTTGEPQNIFTRELPHFCSTLMNRAAIDFVTNQYKSFAIIGQRASMPYIARRLDALGKFYFYPMQAEVADIDVECIILAGGRGEPLSTTKPWFDFMNIGSAAGRPRNVQPVIDALCPSLAASKEQLYRAFIRRYGHDHNKTVGNYLVNASAVELQRLFSSPQPDQVPQFSQQYAIPH